MMTQVGQMKTSGVLKGNPRPYGMPWWGYNYGWPWHGQQSQCYFDPWQGVWVCPTSPWVYQPQISTWYFSRPSWGRPSFRRR